MLIRLIRNQPQDGAVIGRLLIDGQHICDTLENEQTLIATGTYPVRLTMSPRFGEVLPLLDHVVGRSGIRIHPGNTSRDSSGCILVGEIPTDNLLVDADDAPREPKLLSSRKTFNALRETLLIPYREHETILISIEEKDPYPLADIPCPPELCQSYLDAQRAIRRVLNGEG